MQVEHGTGWGRSAVLVGYEVEYWVGVESGDWLGVLLATGAW